MAKDKNSAPFKQGGGLPVVGWGPENRRCDWRALSLSMRVALRALEQGDLVEVLLDGGEVVRATVRAPITSQSPGQFSMWLQEGFRGSYAADRCRPVGYSWRRIGGGRSGGLAALGAAVGQWNAARKLTAELAAKRENQKMEYSSAEFDAAEEKADNAFDAWNKAAQAVARAAAAVVGGAL